MITQTAVKELVLYLCRVFEIVSVRADACCQPCSLLVFQEELRGGYECGYLC